MQPIAGSKKRQVGGSIAATDSVSNPPAAAVSRSSASSSSPAASSSAASIDIPPNPIKLQYFPSFLSAADCESLITMAELGGFGRSTVANGDGLGYVSARRTSLSYELTHCTKEVVEHVRLLVRRLIGSAQRQPEMCIVKYQPGQQFKPHCDSALDRSNPRQYTIFIYLNDVEGGGETHFTRLNLKVKPKQGAALFWENHPSRTSEHHLDSQHAGLPPTSGVKVSCTHWRCAATIAQTHACA
jgi:prolyl 4-hydroxylase